MASGAGTRTATQQESPRGDDWLACARSAMSVVISSLTEAPFGPALESIEGFRDELNALEALLVAQRKRAGFSNRSTESIMKKSGKVSKGEAEKRTKRANAIDENPELAKKMASGDISTEQVDLLAEASEKTDGDAANDPELIDEIAGSNPDQGKSIIRKYVDKHTNQDDRDSRYARQRRRRKVTKSQAPNGQARLTIEGDNESIDAMLRALSKRSDELYRRDGGRDVPSDKHPRTNNQRLFDAAFEQITGRLDPCGDGATDAAASTTDASGTSASKAGSSEPNAPTPTPPANRPGERPTMIFRSDISKLTDDPEQLAAWTAELIGTGLVPSTLASYYRCISDVAVQLVDADGIILKHGRSKRRATPEQWVAMVVRDGGCVDCGAHHTRCEAHHLIPWTAPAKGETNIDDMALMCVDCHHRLHAANFTLEFDPHMKKWLKRPATWDETPTSGPIRRPPPPRRNRPDNRAASNSRPAKQRQTGALW